MTFSNGISNYNPGMPPVFPTPSPIRPDQSALRFLDIPDAIGPLMPWHATDSFASTLFFGDPVIYNPLSTDGFGEYQPKMYPGYDLLATLPPGSTLEVGTPSDLPAVLPVPSLLPGLISVGGVLGTGVIRALFPGVLDGDAPKAPPAPPTVTPKNPVSRPLNDSMTSDALDVPDRPGRGNNDTSTLALSSNAFTMPVNSLNAMNVESGMNGPNPLSPLNSEVRLIRHDSLPSLSLSFSPDLATPEMNYSFVEPGTSEYKPTPTQSSG